MTTVTLQLEDLQTAILNASSRTLATVVLQPEPIGTTSEPTKPNPIGNQATVMSDWAAVPNASYSWAYVSTSELILQYSVEVNSGNIKIGQLQIYSDVDPEEYSNPYVASLPNLLIVDNEMSAFGSTGVSIGIIHDPSDQNVLHFDPSAIDTVHNTITIANHGYTTGTIVFYANFGGAVPTTSNGALAAYRQYTVKVIGPDTIQILGDDGNPMSFIDIGTGINHLSRLIPKGSPIVPKLKSFVLAFQVKSVESPLSFPASAIDTVHNTITIASHGLLLGTKAGITTTGSFPTGLIPTKKYYIVNTTLNTFKLSETRGGTAISLSSQGTGTHTLNRAPWPIITAAAMPIASIAPATTVSLISAYDAVVGSAAQVSAETATHSNLMDAINMYPNGGQILVLSSYETTENISISTNNISICGRGYTSKITGNLTMSGTGCSVDNVRVTGLWTVSGNCNFVKGWVATPESFLNSGLGNDARIISLT